MANTIYGLTNYYNMFISPVSQMQMNPVSNLLYGSIASNVYLQTAAKQAQSSLTSYLTSLNGTVNSLKSSAKPLAYEAPSSSMSKKAVTFTDGTSITGAANWNADARTYGITVSKLATTQTNKGLDLKSGDAAVFNQGLNTFTINSNGITKTAAFTVNAADTNKTALDKMAASINNANAGVSATVVSDAKTGTSYLKVNSTNTGTNNAFTLTDTTGNAVAASGADTVRDQAQNAEYTLDGKQYTSQSNTVKLDYGKVQVTFNKAGNKEIKLTVGADTKAIEADIEKFANNYNNVINLANQYSGRLTGAVKLGDEFGSIMNSRRNTLANIGITINADNTLDIDETKLTNALTKNPSYVEDLFSGSGGIAEKVYSKAGQVMAAPAKYSQPDLASMYSVSYLNALQQTGNMTGAYGLYSGLVLDMML